MKILLFSDLHLHNHSEFAQPVGSGVNTRAVNSLRVLTELKQLVARKNIPVTCFCGDFWEVRGQIPTALLDVVYELLAELSFQCKLLMIRGQHDLATDEKDGPSGLDIFEKLENVHLLSRNYPYVDKAKKLVVFGCNSDENLDELSDACEQFRKYKPVGVEPTRILLMHTIIGGAKLSQSHEATEGLSLSYLQDFMLKYRISQAFVGDVHLRQDLSEQVHYIGNCIQKNFGEAGQKKGAVLYDTKADSVDFVPVSSPQFRIITAKEFKTTYNDVDYFRVHTDTLKQYENLRKRGLWNVRADTPEREYKKERSDISLSSDLKEAVVSYTKARVKKEKLRARRMKLGLDIVGEVV